MLEHIDELPLHAPFRCELKGGKGLDWYLARVGGICLAVDNPNPYEALCRALNFLGKGDRPVEFYLNGKFITAVAPMGRSARRSPRGSRGRPMALLHPRQAKGLGKKNGVAHPTLPYLFDGDDCVSGSSRH